MRVTGAPFCHETIQKLRSTIVYVENTYLEIEFFQMALCFCVVVLHFYILC